MWKEAKSMTWWKDQSVTDNGRGTGNGLLHLGLRQTVPPCAALSILAQGMIKGADDVWEIYKKAVIS